MLLQFTSRVEPEEVGRRAEQGRGYEHRRREDETEDEKENRHAREDGGEANDEPRLSHVCGFVPHDPKLLATTVKWPAVVDFLMSVSGTCQICGEREVSEDCDRCGRLVCVTHFDESIGYCTECATEIRGAKEPTPAKQRDKDDEWDDGVDTFRS